MARIGLAEWLRVSRPVIPDGESGVIRLPADSVMQVAEVLGARTDDLPGLKAPAGARQRRQGPAPLPAQQEIEKPPGHDQEALLRTIEAFISKARGGKSA